MLPTISGEFGRKATITIPKHKPSGKFVVASVLQGHGRKASKNDIVIVNYTAKTWNRGRDVPSTYDKGRAPTLFPVGRGAVIPVLDQAVMGQPVGSRVLVVAPPAAAYGKSGNAKIGVSPTDTVVFVVDIAKVIGAKSTVHGQQQAVPEALPQLHADRSSISIAVPDTAPSKRFISRTLIDGSGTTVKAGQTVVLRHAGAVWATNRGREKAELFDSSWLNGPAAVVIGRGNLIKGLDRALLGAKAGSRMLLVVPPALAYGAQAQKDIPAKSSLVFIVDVLAVA
ncbi:FKBP-type peptidyl-prolyl cis-trans isomerase [Streptomyces sp. A3M-1-3]|uniref:FKBP-type peptidyl-prolyl cis-trans isomerase n=1 Tax=Streptomyces sp. A3M-1-3 TaxID=2962044 RepID=UPI0020B65F57|nr:FKBP-type peptidyl-prolyl cis-trans isomerase [Streptomyces sp. A3M-1-3]MCP3822096.1 FKBP-type peptidyl-prolyl cis-trans isomerase [Streptomyces sp. A3M-1-3]